jgi:hypothetical protein
MMLFSRALLCSLIALALSLLGGPARAEGCKLGYIGETPLRDGPLGLYATVNINGHDVDMRIATGSRWPKVTQTVATTVGLSHEEATGSHLSADWVSTSATGQREEFQATARHLSFAGASANSAPILVLGRRPPESGQGDDNFLGNALLAAFDVDLDTVGYRLVLFSQSTFCTAPKAYMTGPVYTVPILTERFDAPGPPEIAIKIGAHVLRARLSSELRHSAITPQAASMVGVTSAMLASDPRGELRGLGPDVLSVPRHVMTGITIGDIAISKFPMLVYDDGDGNGIDVELGADFIRSVHVWISNSSHTLILQLPPAASPPIVQASKTQ